MSDNDTSTIEAGALVESSEHEGIWAVTAVKKGWVTIQRDEDEHKARASTLTVVSEPEDDEEAVYKMSKVLNKYKAGYAPTTAYSGAKSLNNGDAVAKLLAGASPEQVALIADRALGEADGFHGAKYAHLNPGQIRMNSGNRLRAHAKKGEGEFEDVTKAAATIGIGVEADEAA